MKRAGPRTIVMAFQVTPIGFHATPHPSAKSLLKMALALHSINSPDFSLNDKSQRGVRRVVLIEIRTIGL